MLKFSIKNVNAAVTEDNLVIYACICDCVSCIRLLHLRKLEPLQLLMSPCQPSALPSARRRRPSFRLSPFRRRSQRGRLKFWSVLWKNTPCSISVICGTTFLLLRNWHPAYVETMHFLSYVNVHQWSLQSLDEQKCHLLYQQYHVVW